MTNHQLLAEMEDAIAEARDVVDRLERAYMILCQSDIRPDHLDLSQIRGASEAPAPSVGVGKGRLIHLDVDRTISELATKARPA